MKNTLVILILTSLLIACGDRDSSQSTLSSKKPEKLLACSVFSEKYIKSTYSGATIIQMKEGGRTYPNCGGQFTFGGSDYGVSLTLGVIGGANESTLDVSVSNIKKSGKLIEVAGVGEKAYSSSGMAYQISALNNGNLIHIGVHVDNKFDLEVTKKMANDMFSILD